MTTCSLNTGDVSVSAPDTFAQFCGAGFSANATALGFNFKINTTETCVSQSCAPTTLNQTVTILFGSGGLHTNPFVTNPNGQLTTPCKFTIQSPGLVPVTCKVNAADIANLNADFAHGGLWVAFSGSPNMNAAVKFTSVTVTDSPTPPLCQITFDSGVMAVKSVGGSFTSAVTLPGATCAWTSTSNVPWVNIISGGNGTGNGTIGYFVANNTGATERSGTITFTSTSNGAKSDLVIEQAGSMCTYSLNPSIESFSSSAGTGNFAISTQSGCTWAASSSAPWVSITNGNSGSGNGMVAYSVQANPGPITRTASVTVAGQSSTQSFLVSQGSAFNCTASAANVRNIALEGRTEQIGDMVLTCGGITQPITADLILDVNTRITNTVTNGVSDATLVNAGSSQAAQVLGYSKIYWPGVTLHNGSLTITNVRVDATVLSTGPNRNVTAQLTLNSPTFVPISNPQQTLANIMTTNIQVGPSSSCPAGCSATLPAVTSAVSQTSGFSMVFTEPTPSFFQTASGNTPATRFRVVMRNLSSSTQVSAVSSSESGNAQLYSTDCSGANGSPVFGNSQLQIINGVATATWVLQNADPLNIDTVALDFNMTTSDPNQLQNLQLDATYAPVSPAGDTCPSFNPDPAATAVPRYRDFALPNNAVNLRLTTSASISTQVTGGAIGGAESMSLHKTGAALNPMVKIQGNNLYTWQANGTPTGPDAVSNVSISGNFPPGSQMMSCTAGSGNNCTWSGPGGGQSGSLQLKCSYPSVPGGQTVNCSGTVLLGPVYVPGSTPCTSANLSTNQPPADPGISESNTCTVVNGPQLQVEPMNPQAVSGNVHIQGWAVDQTTMIASVPLQVSNSNGVVMMPSAQYGVSNDFTPALCPAIFGSGYVGCPNIGFVYDLDSTSLPNGDYTITATATNSTMPAISTTSDPITITINNQNTGVFVMGRVVTNTGGGLGRATINVSGTQTKSITADPAGYYSIALQKNGNYTFTASLAGYNFTGPINFNNLTTNQTAVNFTGTPGVTVSGRVTLSTNGNGLPGVIINVTGTLTTSTTTDLSGNYSVGLTSGGNYTVTASLGTFSFTGPINFNNLTTSQTGVNFTATPIGNTAGLQFFSVTPCRIADTRTAAGFNGQFGPPSMSGGQTRIFNILTSPCAAGIPSNVAAYALNFTVVPPPGGPPANLTTWPGTQPNMPNVSTLNYSGSVVANAAIVPAGSDGSIKVFVNFPTDVLFDINGYFAPSNSGLNFYPATPCRIADTRPAAGFTGQFGAPSFSAGQTRAFNLPQSTCAVPAASAYSLNFTVVPPSGGPPANLTTWPATQSNMPNVSTLNYSNFVVANAAIVPAGSNNAINVFVNFPTDVLFDVNGYFAPPGNSGALRFYPVTPCRIADTRTAAGFTGQFGPPMMSGGQTRTFNIPASSCAIPSNAAAYSLNFTVVPPSGGPAANLTTWPTGAASMPNVSTLNYYGNVVANAAIVPAGTNGSINVFANFPTDVLFDINGYFAP